MTLTTSAPAREAAPATHPSRPASRPASQAGGRARGTVVRTGPVDQTALRAPGRTERRRSVSTIAFVIAGLLAWVFVYLFVLSDFQQGHAQKRLYDQLRSELAEGTAPYAAPIAVGEPVALIDSPALGLENEVVVEGTTPAALQTGPGHLLGSVLPGQAGTSVLLGRSVSFGAPFAEAPSLQADDEIAVTTMEGTFRYRVTDVRRQGDPVPAALAAGKSRLVLVTAAGSGSGGPGLSPGATLYVDAALEGDAQPAEAVGAIDPAGAPLERDAGTTTLALLALSLELLGATIVLAVWARHRWSAVAAWMVGAPIVLAALWLTSSVAARLVPNLV